MNLLSTTGKSTLYYPCFPVEETKIQRLQHALYKLIYLALINFYFLIAQYQLKYYKQDNALITDNKSIYAKLVDFLVPTMLVINFKKLTLYTIVKNYTIFGSELKDKNGIYVNKL